ncbi:MAG TPA: histidine phosphatase family protein [Rhizomicrobium sp.]
MPDFGAVTLYVFRHGECEHNVHGLVAAQNDSPLTVHGREQARANGALLKEVAGALDRLDFFASPLHRAAATMELARAAAGLPREGYFADRRLMEIDFGEHTWRTWPDIVADASRDSLWDSDPWNYVHPGGESLAKLHERVGWFLHTLDRDAVIVSHAGTMRMIRAHMLGLSQQATMAYHPPNAGLLRIIGGREMYFGG